MKNKLRILITGLSIILFAGSAFAQSLLPSNLLNYALFTSSGALTNSGTSSIKGSIGTNEGAVTGFPGYANSGSTTVAGTINVANDATLQAAADAQTAYTSLITRSNNFILTNPTLGNGGSLVAGTYFLGEAATINGDLTLIGNSTDIFVIKIDGALSAASGSQIILGSGVSAENVYFNVTGQTALATGSTFRGNIVSGGAIILASGAVLAGRGITTAGQINLSGNNVDNGLAPLPVTLTSFTVTKGEFQNAQLNWITTAETNSSKFEVQRSMNGKTWTGIGEVLAKGESTKSVPYYYSDNSPEKGINMYRLKMIDTDASFSFSTIKSVELTIHQSMALYPNPTVDQLTLDVDDINQIYKIQLTDIFGKSVYSQTKKGSQPVTAKVDTAKLSTGMYVASVTRMDGTVSVMKILKR